MKDNLKTEAETKVEGPISDTLSSLCSGSLDDFQTRVCGWSRMKSSGNEFDCLIHSFLTMVSNEFRRLPESQKDNIASAFRRRLFLQFPAVERSADREAVKKQIPASHVFLTDSELQILSITYKINIIVFEQEKAEKIQQKTLKMPATITPFDNFKDSTTFYLLSEMDKHYEAVKANDSYMISRDTMEMILQKFPQDFTGEAKPSCKYPGTNRDIQEGDIVLYKKSPCMVLEKRYSGDPPSCKKLRVQMLDTDEEQEILTNEISEFNSSGGRRTARTQKKRHSYRRRRWYSVVASTRNRKQRTTRRKV
jgi:hypothetical protein